MLGLSRSAPCCESPLLEPYAAVTVAHHGKGRVILQEHKNGRSGATPSDRPSAPEPPSSPPRRRIAVALQGGGSHGAFTWGVLDRLLEEPSFDIVGISGTSAGAMNAGILADGLRRGGPGHARSALAQYWEDVGRLPGFSAFGLPASVDGTHWHLDNNPVFLWADMLSRILSPYQANPLDYNPLRGLLERIDFEGLRNDADAARVFISATNVRTGLRRVFNNEELSLDVLLASACLPHLYQAVQIGTDHFWDGGYTGNPALAPLYLRTTASDLIVVGINPLERPTVPQTARAIIDRIDEISFNSTFMLELSAIAFVEDLIRSGSAEPPFRPLYAHGIGDKALGSFGASSKMNNDWAFLRHLHEIGQRAAQCWLEENRDAVGIRSTVDLSGLVPPKDGPLAGPSIIRQKHSSRLSQEETGA
jgi:NTE family protein